MTFAKVLVANRGEIAVRILRTCRELGIRGVAAYSDADRQALHVLEADEAVRIGPALVAESYLNVDAVISAALETGAEAVHPGYGLLSENPSLAEACAKAGLVFIGPPPDAIRAMGDKSVARGLASASGVAAVPGYDGDDQDVRVQLKHAKKIGFPVMIKAAAGGGGRGMRLVEKPEAFEEAAESAHREAERAFGDGRLLVERAIVGGRHVEVQVLADLQGSTVHLGERDCSVQRRHQKVIEEAPSPAIGPDLRRKLGEAAVGVARAVGYVNAGTVEFMLDASGDFYFLEMNTRLQVEHGVTEMITGLDLVALQISIAAGEPLPFGQEDVSFNGHAIECRVYAEDPASGYAPNSGRIGVFQVPSGDGVRNDVGTYRGDEISTHYDPLLAKVLTWGQDRRDALARMQDALQRYRVEGVKTNLSLLRALLAHPVVQSGQVTTDFLESEFSPEAMPLAPTEDDLLAAFGAAVCPPPADSDPWRASGPWRAGGLVVLRLECEGGAWALEGRRLAGGGGEWLVTVGESERRARFFSAGERIVVEAGDHSWSVDVSRAHDGLIVSRGERVYRYRWGGFSGATQRGRPVVGGKHVLTAPMHGRVIKVAVREGDHVRARQALVVLEAMKMEQSIEAPSDGRVIRVHCQEGEQVAEGDPLIELEVETGE